MGRDERAAARRRTWQFGFGEHAVPLEARTAGERMAAVEALSQDAWALSGKPWPSYTRATMPGRVIRPGDDGTPE